MNNDTNWTNNFNDTADFDIRGFTVAVAGGGNVADDAKTLSAHSVAQYDDDGNPSLNWAVGDEFKIVGHTAVYSITSLDFTTGTTNANIGFNEKNATTGADGTISHATSGYKEGSYRGFQRSAENHLRLRNMGII